MGSEQKSQEKHLNNEIRKTNDGLFIVPDTLLNSTDSGKLVTLRHPKTQTSAGFLIDYKEKNIYEVQLFKEGNRSWFINESVQSEGKMYIVTLYNPTFLLLPYLLKASKNIPLYDLLCEDREFPSTVDLVEFVDKLSHVADPLGSCDLKVWRYNEKLTLKWLEERTQKLAKVLSETQELPSKAMSVCVSDTADEKELYLKLAYGIISENLSIELSKLLYEHLGLPKIDAKNKENKLNQSQPIPIKKAKISDPVDDYTIKGDIVKTKVAHSAKAKALAKSAAGTKSISSFFKKK